MITFYGQVGAPPNNIYNIYKGNEIYVSEGELETTGAASVGVYCNSWLHML